MKRITYALKLGFLWVALLAGSHAVGQNIGYFAFIPNAEGNIDKDGFEIGYHSIFSQWDLNGDGDISEKEFSNVIFHRLDNDGDNNLSAKEWAPCQKHLIEPFFKRGKSNITHGLKNGFAHRKSAKSKEITFTAFDTNNDNLLSVAEFEDCMSTTNIFNDHNTNQGGKLSQKEFNDMIYQLMDLDGSGIIEKKEFDTVKKLYID